MYPPPQDQKKNFLSNVRFELSDVSPGPEIFFLSYTRFELADVPSPQDWKIFMADLA